MKKPRKESKPSSKYDAISTLMWREMKRLLQDCHEWTQSWSAVLNKRPVHVSFSLFKPQKNLFRLPAEDYLWVCSHVWRVFRFTRVYSLAFVGKTCFSSTGSFSTPWATWHQLGGEKWRRRILAHVGETGGWEGKNNYQPIRSQAVSRILTRAFRWLI